MLLAVKLFAPLLVGLAVHGLCIRAGALRAWTRPIDGGRTLRGHRLFGENKTWRGLVAVAAGTSLGYAVQAAAGGFAGTALAPTAVAALVGFLVGAAAMAAELPNSLLKRQLGIAPGRQAAGPPGLLFHVLDQLDLAVGAWLVLVWFVPVSVAAVLWSLVFLVVVHPLVSLAGFAMGMRTSWR
jgi:CDP-2,3-bis-(O-geranylgeranyl)-sn-glycerol synthase